MKEFVWYSPVLNEIVVRNDNWCYEFINEHGKFIKVWDHETGALYDFYLIGEL